MRQRRSTIKSFTLNVEALIRSMAFECAIDDVDVEMVVQRYKSEGLSFLTKTLPQLSRSVIFSLEKGCFIRPTSFAWKGALLKNFSSHLSKIFSRQGKLLDDCDSLYIKLLRQFCEYFYKLSLEFSEGEIARATEKFRAHDNTVPSVGEYDQCFVDQLRKDFETHYHDISTASVHSILEAHRPRNGPGTYSSVQPNEYEGNWYTRRYYDHATPQKWWKYNHFKRYASYCKPSSICSEEQTSQVLFVPKDSRGPRTIVREPFLSLSYQMSYFDFMSSKLESISRHRINFQDQGINQALARQSSIDRKMSTIDLKDASDSVSYAIIKHIFRYSPGPLYFIINRTDFTQLPDGTKIRLKKLSGMGSGLTFPTMSLLCHLAITRHIVNRTGLSYFNVAKQVYTYGDDIIVPTVWNSYAVDALKRVSLQTNPDKSFSRGFFRESCGADYFKGSDVSFVRLKLSSGKISIKPGSITISGDLGLKTLDAHAAELMKNGLHSVASIIYNVIERKIGRLPFKANDCNAVARYVPGLPDTYFTSTTGYKGVRCLVAVPVEFEVSNEEYFLSQALRESKRVRWEDSLFPKEFVHHSRKAIPRTVKYVRMLVNPLALA